MSIAMLMESKYYWMNKVGPATFFRLLSSNGHAIFRVTCPSIAMSALLYVQALCVEPSLSLHDIERGSLDRTTGKASLTAAHDGQGDVAAESDKSAASCAANRSARSLAPLFSQWCIRHCSWRLVMQPSSLLPPCVQNSFVLRGVK